MFSTVGTETVTSVALHVTPRFNPHSSLICKLARMEVGSTHGSNRFSFVLR